MRRKSDLLTKKQETWQTCDKVKFDGKCQTRLGQISIGFWFSLLKYVIFLSLRVTIFIAICKIKCYHGYNVLWNLSKSIEFLTSWLFQSFSK